DYRKEEILEASRSGNEEIMRLYLTPINVNCHAGDGRKSSPLHLAAGYNRTKIIRLLLQHGADVHAKDKGGLVPLHNACSYGHYEVAELLLQAGASVHAVDLWQFTPLHEAASKGRAEVCALLLAHSADPFHANCHGKTPADLAPTPDLRDRLMRDYKGCCLYNAVLGADSASVKKLITPDLLNYRHPVSGDSLLHACAACATPAGGKRRQIGESLLRKGCQLGDKNRQLQTPLHVAASRGHMDVLELLLKLGAKPNSPDRSGHTPLHAAAGAGHTAACRLLLAYGADPTVHSLDGHSADSVAAEPALAALLAQEACRPTAAPIVAAAAATAAAAASPPSLAAVPHHYCTAAAAFFLVVRFCLVAHFAARPSDVATDAASSAGAGNSQPSRLATTRGSQIGRFGPGHPPSPRPSRGCELSRSGRPTFDTAALCRRLQPTVGC
ncbi:hypothetical protein BOX15_Mlig020447g1, partial [Macrostomum lignano]